MSSRRRQCLPWIAAIVLLFLVAVWLVDRAGRSSRTIGPASAAGPDVSSIEVVGTSHDLYLTWKSGGEHGRRLVHASRFLHFVPAFDDIDFDGFDTFPIRVFDLPDRYEKRVTPQNLLWIALQTGIARRIHHLVPPDTLDEKLGQIGPRPVGARVRGRRILTHEHGSPRVVADAFPVAPEPVLLSVDASYFEARDPGEFLEEMRRASLNADRIVLCRSEDNEEVGPEARARLDELAARLGATAR